MGENIHMHHCMSSAAVEGMNMVNKNVIRDKVFVY